MYPRLQSDTGTVEVMASTSTSRGTNTERQPRPGTSTDDPMKIYDAVPLNDDSETGNQDGNDVHVVECPLEDNPKMNCYYRFVATLHELGHAVSKFPCCHGSNDEHKHCGSSCDSGDDTDNDKSEDKNNPTNESKDVERITNV